MPSIDDNEILSLAEIIQQGIDAYTADMHTCIPGEIVSYRSLDKTATVRPSVKAKTVSDEIVSMPLIDSVPVQFPGSSDAIIHYPLKTGDAGLIVFSEASLEKWISSTSGEVEPGDDRKFSLTDAFFIPGVFTPGGSGQAVTGSGMEIIYKGNTLTLTDAGVIELNGNTKQFVTWTEFNTVFQAFLTALNAQFATKLDGSGAPGALAVDLSTAKSIKAVLG